SDLHSFPTRRSSDLPRTHERIYAEDADRPARRYEQGGEHLHRRGLSGAVRAEKAEDLTRLDDEVDPVDGPEAFTFVVLAAKSLPDRSPAALEDLHQVLRLDRRRGHSTKISTRSSSSAMSTILPGKSTLRRSSSRSMPNFPRCPRTRPLDARFSFPILAIASG